MWWAIASWIGTLVALYALRKTVRAQRRMRAQSAEDRAYLESVWSALQIAQGAPKCDRCGHYFAQVGPSDWAHTYCPAASAKVP